MGAQPATVRPRHRRQIVGARNLVPRIEEVSDDVAAPLAMARRRAALGPRRRRLVLLGARRASDVVVVDEGGLVCVAAGRKG
jgi:hypothetical protein